MRVRKIISGGQTGADQGGLAAGLALGLPTGGWAPRGWKTERGSQPQLLRDLGLQEYPEWGYPPRTRANIRDSDGTLLIGNPSSRGSRLTARVARQAGKPLYQIVTEPGRDLSRHVAPFREWILAHQIQVLNVAGTRESVAPGLGEMTRDFLVRALK